MLSSWIEWLLIVSGFVTAGGGLAALLVPAQFLRLGFGVDIPTVSALFFVRHWGVLISLIASLIVYSAFAPSARTSILIAAATEKFAVGFLIFFGPAKRTHAMTAIAIVDGIFAILYVAYLAGL
jgi:hypothetical protein